MARKQDKDVSLARGEGAIFDSPLETMSFARLLAARLREVFSVEENRLAADVWKLEHNLELQTRRTQNE